MFDTPECSVDGCASTAGGLMSSKCPYHEALSLARNLDVAAFGALRDELAQCEPITDAERQSRRIKSALWNVQWVARDVKRAKQRAIDAGATAEEIVAAVEMGRSEA